jgi:hypothetical protein
MLNNFAATQGGGTGTVTTTTILDGTIANADVASDAAIDSSKINFASTLEIESSSGDQIFEMDNNASNSANFQIQNGAGNARTDFALDGSAIITLKNQMVGIGDTSPSYALDVNSTGRFTSDLIVGGNLTVGDGGAEDQKIVFDGNAKDFYVALDDSADKLLIGEGSTVGTNPILTITDDAVTIGDGATVDTYLNFDGNAADFRIGIDDGTDKLEIGAGTAHGTTAAITIDSSADMTLGGGIACADEEISRPKFKDYAETINALGDLGGGTDAIDFTAGNVVSATVSTSTQTFTFTNPPANGIAGSFTLFLTNGGSQTVNWPGSVDWAGGSAPSLTSSGVDVLTFTTLDAGTTWYGFAAGTDMK